MTSNNTSSRSFISMANKYDRVILLIDMDCFYCQVEEKLDPRLRDQPMAVVQYNAWRGGGIIAVNYAARAKGVTRHMRGDEAKEHCPEIQLVKVPNVREKADTSKYREAGTEVANVLQRFTPLLERASVDEAYLDITCAVNKRLQEMNEGTFILQPQNLAKTYAVGFDTIGDFVTTVTTSFISNPVADDDNFYRNYNESDICAVRQSNIRLLIGASIASEIRCAVKAETSYECSAGIAHNKILAKLACGLNKPNKQTILPLAEIPGLFETLPIGKIKGLGAKFGEEVCESLNIRYLGQLLKFTEAELQRKFDEKNGNWLYYICRGIDLEAVIPRFYSKSIGCCKKFPGRNNITGLKTLQHWLNELANEINERLEKDICENNRRAKQMVVNFIQELDGQEVSSSRSAPLQCYDTEVLANTSLQIIKTNTKQFFRSGSESILNNPIKFLGISVGKFETINSSQNNIQEMFAQQAAKKQQKLKNETNTSTASLTTNLVNDKAVNVPEKQVPKEKKTENNVKSFFLKALQKQQQKENEEKTADINEDNDNDNENENVIVQATTGIDNLVSCSSNDSGDMEDYNELEILESNIEGNNDNSNITTPQKGFFAKVLKRKQETLTKTTETAASSYSVKTPTNNNDLNEGETVNELNEINLLKCEVNEETWVIQNDEPATETILEMNADPLQHVIEGNRKRSYDNMCDNEEHPQTSYYAQYAEFAIPELKPEYLQFINCSKCKAKVLNDATTIQTHEDHHYAQELSKQQRHEFRDEIRAKIISSKSPPAASNKKSKKVNAVNSSDSKTSSAVDIKKFLKPSTSLLCQQNSAAESKTSNTEICEICKFPIEIEKLLEHKDFHIAKDLQRKVNQLEVHTVDIVKNTNTSLAKRKSINGPAHNTTKPITQFFPQSQS